MLDVTTMNPARRRTVGISLMLLGLVPWASLMVYIVTVNNRPSLPLILTVFACWGVFFIGKSILKTRDRETVDT